MSRKESNVLNVDARITASTVQSTAAPTVSQLVGELDGVPQFGSEESKDARDTAITLEFTNRFTYVKDPHAEAVLV
ncbi:iqgap- protein [Marasmius sp. AFHP31]|nr:iqgap- protein [Marasmius sp. AFHP31]